MGVGLGVRVPEPLGDTDKLSVTVDFTKTAVTDVLALITRQLPASSVAPLQELNTYPAFAVALRQTREPVTNPPADGEGETNTTPAPAGETEVVRE